MTPTETTGPAAQYEAATKLWIVAGALGVGLLGLAYLSFDDPTRHARAPTNTPVTAAKANPTPTPMTAVPTASAIPAVPAPSPSRETQDNNHEE